MSDETVLSRALAAIDKKFGKGTLAKWGEKPIVQCDTFSTGSVGLDSALGVGGIPRGRVIEIYGPESCLDAETFVQYEIRTSSGKRQNHKGGTIERLWHRFHGKPIAGRGSYQRPQTVDSEFYVSSINEEGRIFKNRVVDVVRTGRKPCLEILTPEGRIVATPEHKFWTGTRFVPAGHLQVGSVVYVHNNTHYKRAERDRMVEKTDQRAYLYVRHHPVAGVKVVRDRSRWYENVYYRLARSRAVVEAKMNGLDLSSYVERLDCNDLQGLKFLSREDHVHHVDEDITNDEPANLVVISAAEHGRLHAMERHNNLRFSAVPMEVIEVSPAGDRDTYDIRVESPFNNYVANGFVVHNSGKTTLALQVIANAQAAGCVCAFLDAEHALDVTYAAALGVDVPNILINQPDYGEQALEITNELAKTGAVDLIVVDSVAALTPKVELEGDVGASHVGVASRMMSQALRMMVGHVSRTKTTVIFINQLRSKIGVMFGSPETTTGGNALKYYASVRLDTRKISSTKEGTMVVANRTRVKVVKNKLAPPFREAEFDIKFGEGVDQIAELIDLGAELGVVEKAGAWYSFDDTRLGQGKPNAIETLLADALLTKVIDQQVRIALIDKPLAPKARKSLRPKKDSKSKKDTADAVADLLKGKSAADG